MAVLVGEQIRVRPSGQQRPKLKAVMKAVSRYQGPRQNRRSRSRHWCTPAPARIEEPEAPASGRGSDGEVAMASGSKAEGRAGSEGNPFAG